MNAAVATMLDEEVDFMIELGVHSLLSRLIVSRHDFC